MLKLFSFMLSIRSSASLYEILQSSIDPGIHMYKVDCYYPTNQIFQWRCRLPHFLCVNEWVLLWIVDFCLCYKWTSASDKNVTNLTASVNSKTETSCELTRAGRRGNNSMRGLTQWIHNAINNSAQKRENGFTTRKKERANSLQLRPHGLMIISLSH